MVFGKLSNNIPQFVQESDASHQIPRGDKYSIVEIY